MPSPWSTELDQRWPGVAWRILFHGTGHDVPAFTEESIGRGADANAALGVHLAEFPDVAADYAVDSAASDATARRPRVLIVALPARHPHPEWDSSVFFGLEDPGIPGQTDPIAAWTSADFVRWRQQLRERGHDAIDYEDGDQVITVALDPADAVILGEMTVEAARAFREVMDEEDVSFEGAARLERLATWTDLTWRPVPDSLQPRSPGRAAPRLR